MGDNGNSQITQYGERRVLRFFSSLPTFLSLARVVIFYTMYTKIATRDARHRGLLLGGKLYITAMIV